MTAGWRLAEPFVRLTPRQCDVIELVSAGLTNREIARRLCLEVRTVDKHMHDVYARADIDRPSPAARVLVAVLVVRAKLQDIGRNAESDRVLPGPEDTVMNGGRHG